MSREDAAASLSRPLTVQSHTSTHQWQSFEMRMRRRRAERCALRAEAALEAGFPDDAREALDEARRLDPSVADFDALQAAVVEREVLLREERARKTGRRRQLGAAAALLVASSGISGWIIARDPVPTSARTRYGGQAPEVSSPEPRLVRGSFSQGGTPSPDLSAVALAKAEPRVPASALTRYGGQAEPRALSPEARAARERAELPSLPNATILTDVTLPVASRPEPPLPALAQQPVSETGPAPVRSLTSVDEGPRVRAALARYEAAYSALSVSGTQEVQRLSLGQCAVAIDGAAARAECAGTATWTPITGGGSRTEPRNWRFELKNAGGEWQVVRAEAR